MELIQQKDCSSNMKKYELSKIGAFHTNHNEDASAITEIGEHRLLIAVMDGCSMGKESHFVSTLMAKLLRKIGKEFSYREFVEKIERTNNEYLKEIMNRLFQEMRQLKNQLLLEREEVLSTLILGVLDTQEKKIELITVGDGLICCNGKLYEYEQEDKPDYLGYHLTEDFNTWFQSQTQKLSLTNINDLSISTDGIFTFKNFDGKAYDNIEEEEIINLLLMDRSAENIENILHKTTAEIENKFGLKPSDDLTIIRIILA